MKNGSIQKSESEDSDIIINEEHNNSLLADSKQNTNQTIDNNSKDSKLLTKRNIKIEQRLQICKINKRKKIDAEIKPILNTSDEKKNNRNTVRNRMNIKRAYETEFTKETHKNEILFFSYKMKQDDNADHPFFTDIKETEFS